MTKSCVDAGGKQHAGVASNVIILNVHRQQGDFHRYFYFLLSLFYEWEMGKAAALTLLFCAVANKAQLMKTEQVLTKRLVRKKYCQKKSVVAFYIEIWFNSLLNVDLILKRSALF